MSTVADKCTLYPQPPFPDPATADQTSLRESFVLTSEASAVCRRILPLLASYPSAQPRGFIFAGDWGVGKTHLLRYLEYLIQFPDHPDWDLFRPPGADVARLDIGLNSLFLTAPEDLSIDLGNFLVNSLRAGISSGNRGWASPGPRNFSQPQLFDFGLEFARSNLAEPSTAPCNLRRDQLSGSTQEFATCDFAERSPRTQSEEILLKEGEVSRLCTAEVNAGDFAELVEDAARDHSSRSLGMLVLDVSRRLHQLTDSERLCREFHLMKILLEAFAPKGVAVFFVMAEESLKRGRETAGQIPSREMLEPFCDFISLSRNNILEIIATTLAPKNDLQKAEIRALLNRLRQKLPYLGPKAETFTDLYPLHPHVFSALFHVKLVLPEFTPLQFAQEAFAAARSWPADRLITLDFLFDYVLPDLRKLDEYRSVLRAYDSLAVGTLPLLKPSLQAKAHRLLKGIAFLTICESYAPTVKSLTNSLLLYDDSDYLPSYSLTSALLVELEQTGGRYLVAEGEKLDRSYRLLDPGNQEGFSAGKDLLDWEEEFRLKFPLLVYDWLHSEIPAWKPDTSSKYQRTSQPLAASIPEGGESAPGLVYFKSVFDPPLTTNDLAAMMDSGYHWVVLILSPFERFYEFDQSLRELAANWDRLVVWHPGTPTASENERLRKAAAQPSIAEEVAREARGLLRSLYVERAQLFTASDQWCLGEELGDRSLARCLSQYLARLVAPAEPGVCPAPPQRKGSSEGPERQALHWASLLAGPDPLTEPETAKSKLLEWWEQIQTSGLLEKLYQMPDAFSTTRFWNEVKSYENCLEALKPILARLKNGQTSLVEAMAQVAGEFNQDESRLQGWKQFLENMAGLSRWLPWFEHARDYLYSAIPTLEEELEQRRSGLVDAMESPQRFLEAAYRDTFDETFLGFKTGYIDYYHSMHEGAMHIVGNMEKMESKVDYVALRNLEMLSKLHYTDKSYLNRVRIIGKYLRANQCNLPVREILDRYPRCYCNFNPTAGNRVTESIEQMNGIIQEGIEYFRAILRKSRLLIIQDLEMLRVDDYHSKQIAALLSQGRMIPLKAQSVDILNKIIQRHSADFLAEIRSRN